MELIACRPKTPGWYWYMLPGSWPLQPVLVFDGGKGFGLMYTLEPIDFDHNDFDRDGMEMDRSSENALWSDKPISMPLNTVEGL